MPNEPDQERIAALEAQVAALTKELTQLAKAHDKLAEHVRKLPGQTVRW